MLYWQLAAQAFSLLVGIFSLCKKSVSVSGFIALCLISGLFIWTGQLGLLFVLFFMFASSSIWTKFKQHRKKEFISVVGRTGPRDYIQALCNLGASTVTLLLYLLSGSDAFIAALIGSVAAANADSWASEIGGLSKQTPRLITTWSPVSKGVSGGITLLGMCGGVAGSGFIVLIGGLAVKYTTSFSGNLWAMVLACFLSGIVGCVLDSYIGAWWQALYRKSDTNEVSERPAEAGFQRIKGISWINNDVVNFITTIASAILAAALYLGIR